MDRNKPTSSGRPPKSKLLPHHSSELFALGSKSSSRDSRDEAKSKAMSSKTGSSSVPDRKRDSSSSSSMSSANIKKPKLSSIPASSSTSSSAFKSSGVGGGEPSSNSYQEYWESVAIECEPVDLITSILTAIDQQDSDKVVALVCGAIKLLLSPRAKPDSVLTLSFLYLAKIRPNLFCNEIITSALASILRRDAQHASFRGRHNQIAYVLAANLLARGYHDKKQWPEAFLRLYIDDAFNERVWVDFEECSAFVDNICTAFGTKNPPKSLLQPELSSISQTTVVTRDTIGGLGGDDTSSGGGSSDVSGVTGGAAGDSLKSDELINFNEYIVQPRYGHIMEKAERLVMDTIKEQLNRRQTPDASTRNFLKFLANTSGLVDVRAMAVTRLESWMHNGKLNKPAQELLTYICYNVSGLLPRDQEVLANLVKMRLKTKPLINIYMICLKEMINLQPAILLILMKYVVQNELSNARNPNNMGMLANMFQAKPEESARHLAEIYQEFLMQREDCLRTLRVFLRELVKMLRYDINLMIFCKSLMSIREELQPQINSFEFKDRIFNSMVDLICLSMFLLVSPQIREANLSMKTGRDKGSAVLFNFYSQMSEIQCDALTWMHQIVPVLFSPNATEYAHALHKLLLLDTAEQYSKSDQWPPEPERNGLLRLVAEVPLNQDSILRIILIGITKEISFSIPDSMEIIEQIVRRSAGLRNSDYPPLEANKLEIIDFLFSMAEYHHPEKIVLPAGYEPPKLAITALYWKAWNILLMLSAHNPSIFGSYCWEHYPILRNLMEMCITNQFNDIRVHEEELQICALEKSQILEFETHLAAATSKIVITEQSSLLLSQLMLMDPMGISRRPPNLVLDQLKSLNRTHRLGHLLCRSRQPDLLLDIIQRHGTSQSLPWLADLVQNSDGDFNHLPVQCLCEFLLANSNIFNTESVRDTKLLTYLQKLLQDETTGHQQSCEVLEYFLRRLSSTSKQSRFLAIKGLRLLLSVFQMEDDGASEVLESDWLLKQLPQTPHFHYLRAMVVAQLRAACQVENSPELIMIYIQFIAERTLHDSVSDMLEHVMDMSQLIVERSTVFSYIIPADDEENGDKVQTLNCLFVMFNNFLIKLREQGGTQQTWPEYPDLLMVHFPDGTQSPVHLNIIQAFVILLTYTPLIPGAMQIIEYWFPINFPIIQAFTLETSEPIQILPDWLKLKMIRSPVERLVDVALIDLTPDQIVLFVQNFGTPVTSMSKLLALLDRAVIEQFEIVKSTILNTAYLAQLIELQQARGAKNGHIAVQALGLQGQVVAIQKNTSKMVLNRLDFEAASEKSIADSVKPPSKTKEIEEVLDIILTKPVLERSQVARYRRMFQQLVGKEPGKKSKLQDYVSSKMLNYLVRVTQTPHAPYLFQNMFQNASLFSLFRCLLVKIPDKIETRNYLVQVMDLFIQKLNPIQHSILLNILLNKRKMFVKMVESKVSIQSTNYLDIFRNSNNFDVESKGRQLLNQLMRISNSSYSIESLTALLKNDITGGSGDVIHGHEEKNGIIVDWLSELDSELIRKNPTIQMELLFSKSLPQFRFYMLSLLSHQASWSTLHVTINRLLGNYNSAFDSTSVLDYIMALVNNPKLWQGRDKATPKHEQNEYILKVLREREIYTLIEYILNETLINEVDKEEKLSLRINMLIKYLDFNEINLKKLIFFVNSYTIETKIKEMFLKDLYLNMPSIKFFCHDLGSIFEGDLTKFSGCPADKVIQYVITTISSLSNQREYQQMSQDTEFLIRKLAASHPSLFLRQLSVLSGLLQGRAHMELHVLRCDYHISLFIQVLGILDILQPHVFDDAYKNSLQDALKCYFDLLLYHNPSKDIYYIMCHFMDFLQSYIHANATSALSFVEPYIDLIQHLAMTNKQCVTLQQLVQGVSLLKHKTETVKEPTSSEEEKGDRDLDQELEVMAPPTGDNDQKGAAAIILAPSTKQFHSHRLWNQLVAEITKYPVVDDLVPTLQEIETITTKRPALLIDIFEKILLLLVSPIQYIRSTANVLLVRHLKNNPGNTFTNSTALKAYIQCLTHEDVSVTISALDTLTEMVICLQEHSLEILSTVFNLTITSKLNSTNQIRKCIAALKTQHAC